MASSKVMPSTSPPNPDLPRQSTSSSSIQHQQQQHHLQLSSSIATPAAPAATLPHPLLLHHSTSSFGSMNMEEILKNIYSEPDNSLASAVDGSGAGGVMKNVGGVVNKTVDEVWKDIVSGGGGTRVEPRMTLEEYLTKAGAVNEEDVRVQGVPPPPGGGVFGVEAMMNASGVQFPAAPGPVVHMQNGPGGFGMESQLGFGNGMVAAPAAAAIGGGGGGGSSATSGRGKRRAAPVEELTLDKATQQKQRRMIKNRESAARSRERKQAYTVELESLVTQLEEENARLLREEAELNKARFKQLMENLIPVVEKQRPPRVLRRVQSMSW